MKTYVVIFALLLFGYAMQAQQYIIRYDLAGENISYLKVKKPGDTSTAPVIHLSKTNRVNLQLVNAANSYRRELSYIEKTETAEPIIIPGFGNIPTSNLSGGGLPAIDFKSLGIGDIFKKTSDNKDAGFGTETKQQKLLKELFTSNYNTFNSSFSKWERALQLTQHCRVLWKELAGLRYSLQLPAEEVKKTARVKTQSVFPAAGDNPNLILVSNAAESPAAVAAELNKNFSALQKTYSYFNEYEVQSTVADGLLLEATKRTELVNSTPASKADSKNDDVINRIADLYGQILNDSYSQLTPLNITSKTMMAEIRFTPLIDSVTASALNIKRTDTITRLIPIYKKEPLRFRNTFGFSFVSFAENRWHYYLNPDSIIARETADQFQPVVVTYLHFYSPSDKGFRWGGTFGAGLPVGGDNAKLNIMLGLSTFFGKNDPVSLTAGIAGAQVKKLSGWKLGDKVNFSELSAANYTSVYRIGYFLALTFNPGSLNMKD